MKPQIRQFWVEIQKRYDFLPTSSRDNNIWPRGSGRIPFELRKNDFSVSMQSLKKQTRKAQKVQKDEGDTTKTKMGES